MNGCLHLSLSLVSLGFASLSFAFLRFLSLRFILFRFTSRRFRSASSPLCSGLLRVASFCFALQKNQSRETKMPLISLESHSKMLHKEQEFPHENKAAGPLLVAVWVRIASPYIAVASIEFNQIQASRQPNQLIPTITRLFFSLSKL